MSRKRSTLTAVFLLLLVTNLFSQAFVTVSIGHARRVNQIVMHPESPFAFSAGEDGRVLRWDLSLEGLVQQAQLADSPLTHIAHHPTRNQITVFARESISRGRLIAWDWESEQVLFEQSVDGFPQFVRYSPAGTFLVVATNDFDSLRFYSSQTGNQRNLLNEGFGAVSFVHIARSERNILTYIPTRGELIYWDLQTGRERLVVETQRRLEDVTLIDPENQRLLAGYTDEGIVVIDNLSGNLEGQFPLSPIHDLTYSQETDTIYVLTERFGDPVVRGLRYANGRLRQTSYRGERVESEVRTIAAIEHFSTHALLSGSNDGSVVMYTETAGRPSVIGTADYLRIEDLTFVGNRLTVTAGNRIVTFESDLFTGTEDGGSQSVEMNFLRDSTRSLPALTNVRAAVAGNALLVWGSSVPGTIWRLEADEEPVVAFERAGAAPIARVRPTEEGLLILFRDGLIVLDSEDEAQRFEYRSSGAQDAVWDPDIGLVIAQTQGSLFDSSIVVVDPNTGETVPMRTGAFLTRSLALDSEQNAVYALSLTGEQNNPRAEIVRYSGRGLSRDTVLFRGEAGRTSGTITWDARTETLFTTIATGSVLGIEGSLEGVSATTARNPLVSAAGERILASGNADGTVSLFWKQTGHRLADVIVFPEGWIVTAGRGYLTSNDELKRYLTVVPLSESARSIDVDELELNLPLLSRPDF